MLGGASWGRSAGRDNHNSGADLTRMAGDARGVDGSLPWRIDPAWPFPTKEDLWNFGPFTVFLNIPKATMLCCGKRIVGEMAPLGAWRRPGTRPCRARAATKAEVALRGWIRTGLVAAAGGDCDADVRRPRR